MPPRLDSIVVVGASLAGISAAHALRRLGFAGKLTVVGAEEHPPYQRPPLSKQVLAGEWDQSRITLRIDPVLEADWRLGRRAVRLHLERRELEIEGGERLPFGGLVIATGASPRWVRGLTRLDGVFALRTIEDALAIRERVDRGARSVAIVGAGFIGSEVAASLRKRGLDVTLIDVDNFPMQRVLGAELGRRFLELHRTHGVRLEFGIGVTGVEGNTNVQGVRLGDGRVVDAELVVVGVGVAPAVDWLEGSGLTLADGLVCDQTCAAVGAEGVVAAGDAARWHNPLFDASMRTEHWDNAVAQGEAAAHTLLAAPGETRPYASVPFFWSDQYDCKLQMVGAPRPDDEMRIVEGTVDSHRFVAAFLRGGRVCGAFALNSMHRIAVYRRLIEKRQGLDALEIPAVKAS